MQAIKRVSSPFYLQLNLQFEPKSPLTINYKFSIEGKWVQANGTKISGSVCLDSVSNYYDWLL